LVTTRLSLLGPQAIKNFIVPILPQRKTFLVFVILGGEGG